MKKIITLLMALTMCAAIHAQEIEKPRQIPLRATSTASSWGEAKFKTVDGVLYAVGYEGTRDWILVRYPAGSRNESYTVHPYCRRIARGAFQGQPTSRRSTSLPLSVTLATMPSQIVPHSQVSTSEKRAKRVLIQVSGVQRHATTAMPARWHATISLAATVPLPTTVCRSSSTQTIPRVPSSKTEYKKTLIPISRSLSFVPNHTLVPVNQ